MVSWYFGKKHILKFCNLLRFLFLCLDYHLNLLKKVLSIVLLLSLILPFVGTVSWLNYQKKIVRRQIKHEIIAGIERSELVNLTFTLEETQSQLNWKHSKEFEYNNNMYDIVEADTIGNVVTYWCWWDYEETKLNKELTVLLAQFLGNDTQNKETKTRFAQFYKSLYLIGVKPWEAIDKEITTAKTVVYDINYTSIYFPPLTPPPNYS